MTGTQRPVFKPFKKTNLMKKILYSVMIAALVFAGYACSSSSDSPELNVSVSNLDFGNVRTGEVNTLTLDIRNDGDVTLDDVNVAVTGAGFAVAQGDMQFALNVGQSRTVSITFTTDNPGDFSGSVTVSSVSQNLVRTVNLAAFAVDAIVGTWISQGEDIAPGLAGPPFLNVEIVATFNADNTYNVESLDTNGSTISFTGTWVAGAPNAEGIRSILLEQATPFAAVSSGIFRINGSRMEYEVIQQGLTGVEPPTVEGGFGSTLIGGNPTGAFWIQRYSRVEVVPTN